jgi:Na+-transporting methylmalonyl-CoA/oxaloacetate decarboxylase gamma subunit
MDIIQALMIAVSGFLVVFIMLVLLWGIIALISKAVTATERTAQVMAPVHSSERIAESEAEEQPVKAHEIYGGEIALYDVDEKTAACIMAIVSDSSGIPLDHLIFRSIRALD